MPCRVGITTRPTTRKAEWARDVVGLRNWKQKFVGSKSDAQAKENERLKFCRASGLRGRCHAYQGGGDPSKFGWYLYEFDYDKIRVR